MRLRRRSVRLKGYDYSQAGAYFITICTNNRDCLFGKVVHGEMRLNDIGQVAERCWRGIPRHFPHTELDTFVVMPNHVHGIIWIMGSTVGAKNFSPLQNVANRPVLRSLGFPGAQIKFEYSQPVKIAEGKFESTAAIKSETGTKLDIKAVSSDTVTVSDVRQDGNDIWVKVSPVK